MGLERTHCVVTFTCVGKASRGCSVRRPSGETRPSPSQVGLASGKVLGKASVSAITCVMGLLDYRPENEVAIYKSVLGTTLLLPSVVPLNSVLLDSLRLRS